MLPSTQLPISLFWWLTELSNSNRVDITGLHSSCQRIDTQSSTHSPSVGSPESTNNTMTSHENDDPKSVEVDDLLSQFELATRKITVLERKVVDEKFKISVQQKAMQNYTDRLSKMKRQICKLRKTNDSLKNDKIRLKKVITKQRRSI